MYRPTFPLVAVNQIDIQTNSKTVNSGHTSPMPLGPALCEDGHPFVSDPVTGRKLCTCSLGLEVTYDPRSIMSDARKQGMALSGSIGGPSMGIDTSAFYAPLIRGIPIRQDRLPPYMTPGMPGQPLNFDPSLAAHPYGLLYAGMDVNGGPIRKAATRETTGPLKIWLSEHKKNPYPTKAEKIMLAIITRMTLTQVSTWFANARRRLKKDNRLSPGSGEDDNVGIDSDREGDMDSVNVQDIDEKVKSNHRTDVPLSSEGEADPDVFSDISDDDNEVFRPESRDTSRTPCEDRIRVITSTPEADETNISTTSPETTQKDTFASSPDSAPSNIFAILPVAKVKTCTTSPDKSPSKIFATSSVKLNILPDCHSSETQKPKPKIWSISHILDS